MRATDIFCVLVVLDQFTRRIVGFGVQAVAVDGPALCRLFKQAISGQGLTTRLSTDHDPLCSVLLRQECMTS